MESNNILKFARRKSTFNVSGEIGSFKPKVVVGNIEQSISDSFDVDKLLAFSKEDEEVSKMDNNSDEILLKYIDSLDKKYDALKNDLIESEKRITQNNKELEQRLEKRYVETNNNINKLIDKIDTKFDTLDNKVDTKIEKMSMEIKENNKYLRSISITTTLSIAAMVIAIIAALITVIVTLKP